MKALLICPSKREPVSLLAGPMPLSNVPFLGQSLLEYWLSSLAMAGVQTVAILAHDRPEQVQALVGEGKRWGLEARVIPESRELTPAQAIIKYEHETQPTSPQRGIAVLDHFPGLPEYPLFDGYQACFAAIQEWLPRARTPERVGIRELRPGVWAGSHAQVAPQAELRPPCWIGNRTFVSGRTTLGPHCIIEDGCLIEGDVEIAGSYIGPDTFVGRYAELAGSLAWGSTLINWKSGSITRIPDPFLLCALRNPTRSRVSWFSRLSRLYSRNKEEAQLLWKHLLLDKES